MEFFDTNIPNSSSKKPIIKEFLKTISEFLMMTFMVAIVVIPINLEVREFD